MTEALPLGPEVDATPRPLPARVAHRGAHVTLEPLHVRHAPDLWRAAQGADQSWAYLGYGPFESEAALRRQIGALAAQHDPMFFAVRPHASGLVTGWLSFMEIRPGDADIEIGHIWFGPALQRTRAATEAIALLMRHAMDDLGYRRLVWKCHTLNAASRRAADRLGFVYEGTHRNHRIIKGRSRDTAWYSITDAEWPLRRAALAAWLDDANFDHAGTPRRSLGAIRAALAAGA
ncbi:GNAT family N-acetyltransferase [Elioraea sp.]|uniref:GNAT family N-acetyltransferase n=1 Tax=Elioraea sp. TaxID=2185103 RepID=UPI0021DEBE74|nr:GNAT family protein [Elioraea sp.]GIX10519.1 MAG: N-acetyltransferase [Elioraea sp.]